MFQRLRCIWGKHRPDRHRVWNDSINHRAACRGCGVGLIRDIHGWRVFGDGDHDLRRLPHPAHGGAHRHHAAPR